MLLLALLEAARLAPQVHMCLVFSVAAAAEWGARVASLVAGALRRGARHVVAEAILAAGGFSLAKR